MSDDEVFAAFVGGAIALFTWFRWIRSVLGVTWLGAAHRQRALLLLAPATCLVGLLIVLDTLSAQDVRDSGTYIAFYLLLGAAWLGLFGGAMHLSGISARDDVVERRNAAAACAVTGGLVGLTFCYAGGNIGDGPGWWVVIFAAALATGGLALVGLVVAAGAGLAYDITVERDVPSGVRYGCLLAACGLVLGRAVAGNWISAEATLEDFGRGAWPVLVPVAVELVLRGIRAGNGRPARGAVNGGIFLGGVYVAAAVLYVVQRGAW